MSNQVTMLNHKAYPINTFINADDHHNPHHIAEMSTKQFDQIIDEIHTEINEAYDEEHDTVTNKDININLSAPPKIEQDNTNNNNITDIAQSPSFMSSPDNIVSNINTIFRYISQLGKGASCRVLKAIHLKNNKLYAVKELTKSDEINKTLFEKEVHLLRKLLHPNIVRYYDCYMDNNNYYIATEYCSGKYSDINYINLSYEV